MKVGVLTMINQIMMELMQLMNSAPAGSVPEPARLINEKAACAIETLIPTPLLECVFTYLQYMELNDGSKDRVSSGNSSVMFFATVLDLAGSAQNLQRTKLHMYFKCVSQLGNMTYVENGAPKPWVAVRLKRSAG